MSKAVRIIALIMAILLGLSALGMIAMYVAAETPNAVSACSTEYASALNVFETAPIYCSLSQTV